MAGRSAVAVAAVVLVLVTGARAGARLGDSRTDTRLGDCTHNLHCGPDSCCLVGFMRYSIPSCSPLGDVGSHCSPGYSEPSSRTLHYPNGLQVVLEEAHFGLCPCRPGLVCARGACRESEPATDAPPSIESNSLDSEYDY